jgi:hypothetical protein
MEMHPHWDLRGLGLDVPRLPAGVRSLWKESPASRCGLPFGVMSMMAARKKTGSEGLMQLTGIATNGIAPRAARLTDVVARVGIVAVIALGGWSTFASAVGAETTSLEPQQVGASNGGVASTTSEGNVEIGEIVTGENTGNSVVTGDVAGSAEFNGGENDYPTEINVTLIVEPSITSADGGDAGEAKITPDRSDDDDDSVENNVTIINRNDNRSSAVIK